MPSPRGLINILAALFGGIALLAGLVGFTSIPSSAVQYPASQSAAVADAATTSSTVSQDSSFASSSEAIARPVATTTIIYKYITEPAPSSSPDFTVTSAGVSEAELTQKLQQLQNALESRISSIMSDGSTMASGGVINMIAASNKIDQLNGTTLSNVTVSGVSGLTAADIPDLSGKYLSLGGGTLTGALVDSSSAASTFGGSVGIGTTSPWAQFSVNPNGINGPAFAVGSSTATDFVVNNAGNVGIGTTNPSAKFDVNGAMKATSLALGGATIGTDALAVKGTVSISNPVDVYDDMSGPAGQPVAGRMPTIGAYAWSVTGSGYLRG